MDLNLNLFSELVSHHSMVLAAVLTESGRILNLMVEHTRTLGFWVAFALELGTMIAAGIFPLSGTAVAEIGSSTVIAFVIAALIAGITTASYSEFASIYAENGGGYLFTSRTFEREKLEYAVDASLFPGYTGTTTFYLATIDDVVAGGDD